MAEISSMYTLSSKLIENLKDGLTSLELIESGSRHGDSTALARQLISKLADLKTMRAQLDSTWRVQSLRDASIKRDTWRRKVQRVAEETDALQAALDKYGTRERQRAREAEERRELFERAESGRKAASAMDEENMMAGSIHRSKQALETMFEQGAAVMSSMMGTREQLKTTQRKVLDVLNSVGLGDKLLRMIDRRQRMDKWLVYGGMALVVLVTIALFWWRIGH